MRTAFVSRAPLAALAAAILLGGPAEAASGPPYPVNGTLAGVTFNTASFRQVAGSAEGWPSTAAADGTVYTAWGNGGGFGQNASSQAFVSIGIGSLTGTDAASLQGTNLIGGLNPADLTCFPAPPGSRETGTASPTHPCAGQGLDGKSYSLLALAPNLYAFVTPGSGAQGYNEARLYRWATGTNVVTRATWAFTPAAPARLLEPGFLQVGKGAFASDHYVYAYAARFAPVGSTSSLSIQDGSSGGEITLLRALGNSDLTVQANWSYFAGATADGSTASWTSNPSQLKDVIVDPNGVGWTTSAVFDAPLGLYLVLTQHGAQATGQLTILAAPNPWGPWSTVAYTTLPGPEQHAFYYDILPTSISADGLSFTLLYSGTDTGALLAMNGTFTPGGGGAFPDSTTTGGTAGSDTGTSGTSMFGTSGSGQSSQSQAGTSSTPQYGPLGSDYPSKASATKAEAGPEAEGCPAGPEQAATAAPAGGDATAADEEDAASAAPGTTALITPSPASETAGTRLLSATGPCPRRAGATDDGGSRPLREAASTGTVRLR